MTLSLLFFFVIVWWVACLIVFGILIAAAIQNPPEDLRDYYLFAFFAITPILAFFPLTSWSKTFQRTIPYLIKGIE